MSSHWVFMSLCYFVLCTDLLPQLSGSVTGCLSFFPSGGLVFLLVRMVLILELIPHLPRPSLGFLPVGLAWAHLCINVESRTCAVQGNWPGDVRCRQLVTCLTSAGWWACLKNPGGPLMSVADLLPWGSVMGGGWTGKLHLTIYWRTSIWTSLPPPFSYTPYCLCGWSLYLFVYFTDYTTILGFWLASH